MKETKYIVKPTSAFKRDFKRAIKQGREIEVLEEVISYLAMGKELPEKYKDHGLTGNWMSYRECHIQPDWLLIYRIDQEVLVLILARTGSHSQLF